jgi:hypothetical protein
MRNVLITLAAAASGLAVASPASAQYYPQPLPQSGISIGVQYGSPYGYQRPQYGYGYQAPQYGYGYRAPQYGYGYQAPQYGYQTPQYGYGYRAPQYGQSYGYQGYGQAQAMKVRIDHIQREISRLARYRMISHSEYHGLLQASREIEQRFYRNAADGRGLSSSEMYEVQIRVARLEQQIARDVRDRRQWGYRW